MDFTHDNYTNSMLDRAIKELEQSVQELKDLRAAGKSSGWYASKSKKPRKTSSVDAVRHTVYAIARDLSELNIHVYDGALKQRDEQLYNH